MNRKFQKNSILATISSLLPLLSLFLIVFASAMSYRNPYRDVIFGILVMGFILLIVSSYLPTSPPNHLMFVFILTLLGFCANHYLQTPLYVVLAILAYVGMVFHKRFLFWIIILAVVALQIFGLVHLWQWGTEPIDVFGELQKGSQFFLHGENPYFHKFSAFVFEDPNGKYFIPFHYGPSIIILASFGRIFGDVRVTSLFWILVTYGIIIWNSYKNAETHYWKIMILSLAILPVTIGMIVNGWVDSYMVGCFALWFILRFKIPVISALFLGLALAGKPTLLPAIVPFFIFIPKLRKNILFSLVWALVIIVPFALWTGPMALYNDVIAVHYNFFHIRTDAYSFNGFLYARHLPFLPSWLGAVITLLLLATQLIRSPKTYSQLFLMCAALVMSSYIFSQYSFFNYHYVVIVLILLSLSNSKSLLVEKEKQIRLRAFWRSL